MSDFRERVTEWLTGNDTCFLIGAGCSACSGKPLIGALTTSVLEGMNVEKLSEHFRSLKAGGGRAATIENLMNYLARYRDVLASLDQPEGHPFGIEEIDTWLTGIKNGIVREVAGDDPWKPSEYHERFLRRLRTERVRDIFTLNYDTLLEASLEALRVPYTEGFRGANQAWFDPEVFDDAVGVAYRIHKLHGSINWRRDEDGNVRRVSDVLDDAGGGPVVVYPSEQKYLQTQYGIYETLIARFRDRLRATGKNNHLVVLGYSFNDEHINEAICDAVIAEGSNLTVVAFVGPEADDRAKQDNRLKALAGRCDERFNAFVGGGGEGAAGEGSFIGSAMDTGEAGPVLEAGLWRFESLVDFVAGETS